MASNIIAIVSVIPKINETFPSDDTLLLFFASSDLDRDGQQKPLIGGVAELIKNESTAEKYKYVAKIQVPKGFGEIGAVIVELKDDSSEKFIDTVIVANPTSHNTITFSCTSWVQPKSLIPDQRRVFFSTKSNIEIDFDPKSEQRSTESFYVPRDEAFSEVKQKMFPSNPGKKDKLGAKPFTDFTQIDLMFRDGIAPPSNPHEILQFNIISTLNASNQPAPPPVQPIPVQPNTPVIKFPPPEALKRDKFNWLSDSEFARQTIAGLNPYCIQLVKSWPLKSELDPVEYGPQESAFTTELVQKLIGSSITVEEAIAQKKLFVLDYHDTLMQYVEKVRSIKRTTLYGSRTLFFLNDDDTLSPLGIELTRPPMAGKPQWKQVFSPSTQATNAWLWRLAKAHVLAHDSCVHQLVIHWNENNELKNRRGAGLVPYEVLKPTSGFGVTGKGVPYSVST
uniref:Lipoxygenase n=1 Tax=Cucumis sativus TaxID=3659 RepID=A0A0A0KX68_CUCSA